MAFFIGNSFCKLCQNDEENLQNELLSCSNGLKAKGLFPANKSFYSTRLPNSNKIWITSLINKNFNNDDENMDDNYNSNYFECNCMNIDDLKSVYNLNFFEFKLHSKLYKFRPDVNAICHTKSPYTLSSFFNGKLENVHGEAALILGDIPVINVDRDSYELHNSTKNNDTILDLIVKSSIGEPLRPIRILILLKHGVIALGACLHEARAFIEILEEWSRFNIYSKTFISGGDDCANRSIHILSLEQLRSLGARYARSIKFGGRQSFIYDNSTK